MKTQKEYQKVFDLLDASARTMLGCWAAFSSSGSGHHGLAEMALAESKERAALGMKVARHMISQDAPITLPILPAPQCEYATPLEAIKVMCDADKETCVAVSALYTATVSAGESPHYVTGLQQNMNHEIMELHEIKQMIHESITPEDLLALNKKMLKKYT